MFNQNQEPFLGQSFSPNQPPRKNPRKISLLGILLILLMTCFCCLIVLPKLTASAVEYANRDGAVDAAIQTSMPALLTQLPTDFVATVMGTTEPPTSLTSDVATAATPSPQPTGFFKKVTTDELLKAQDTYEQIRSVNAPFNSFPDNAVKFGQIAALPTDKTTTSYAPVIGEQAKFWVMDVNTSKYQEPTATLQYKNDVVYFWVDNDSEFELESLGIIGDEFAKNIYPTTRNFFGAENTTGVDGDQHIYVLFTDKGGAGLGGYFASDDSYAKVIKPYSNEHKMFVINANTSSQSPQSAIGTLAHEFQHMIHWNTDKNEETWLNEGFAQLSSYLNRYSSSGEGGLFQNPNYQLNYWPMVFQNTGNSYSASYMFATYLAERVRGAAIQAIVKSSLNGFESIDQVLQEKPIQDVLRNNQNLTADDLFADFAIANLLNNPTIADGRYAYQSFPQLSPMQNVQEVACPVNNQLTFPVKQYATQYLKINCPTGDYQLNFDGSDIIPIVDTNPVSGDYMLWSNVGDQSDFTTTRFLDLTESEQPINLEYRVWYDLEDGFDYGYLEVSFDQQKWQIIKTPHSTDKNDSGNNYGWGYTGKSNEWLKETVDLSAYAGKEIWLRFEVLNDMAVHGEGLLLDDIKISNQPEQENFEKDSVDWQNNGFIRIENKIPQNYAVSLINQYNHPLPEVVYTVLNEKNQETIRLHFDEAETKVLVVNGLTRNTIQASNFTVLLEKQ